MINYNDTVNIEDCVSTVWVTLHNTVDAPCPVIESTIRRAYLSICNYLWCDELPRGLEPAVEVLSTSLLKVETVAKSGLVTQQTQGSRSVSYSYGSAHTIDADGLTSGVRAMLPPPRMRYVTP